MDGPGGGGGGSWGEGDYPEDNAKVVKEWAVKAGQQAVITMVDKIRDWLGHPEKVMSLAETWSPDASRFISDSKEGMTTAQTDLKAYWEGTAYDAFVAYTDHVLKVVDSTYKVMTDMSDHMLELRKTITETYKAAITFISECARTILNAANDVIQNIKNLWGGVAGAILQALSKFIGDVTTLEKSAMDIMTDYDVKGAKLLRRASELQVPDPMPGAAGVNEQWKVRKTG